MTSNQSEKERVGLCFACRHVRLVRTDRGSVFYQCQRSAKDPGYPKYPRLPVRQCRGYEMKEEMPESSRGKQSGTIEARQRQTCEKLEWYEEER